MSLPLFVEDSKVPVVLSYFSPISIGAITLGPVVFSRGKMSDQTKNHEAIHWEQYKETLIIGFLLIYVACWVLGMLKYKSGSTAYYMIPFEQEAYNNDSNFDYLQERKKYSWLKYGI